MSIFDNIKASFGVNNNKSATNNATDTVLKYVGGVQKVIPVTELNTEMTVMEYFESNADELGLLEEDLNRISSFSARQADGKRVVIKGDDKMVSGLTITAHLQKDDKGVIQ